MQSFKQSVPVVVAVLFDEDRELVAAYPENGAVGKGVADQLAGGADILVARLVTLSIVYVLQAVYIADDDGKVKAVVSGIYPLLYLLLHFVVGGLVAGACQVIAPCQLIGALEGGYLLFLLLDLFVDVLNAYDEMYPVAGPHDRHAVIGYRAVQHHAVVAGELLFVLQRRDKVVLAKDALDPVLILAEDDLFAVVLGLGEEISALFLDVEAAEYGIDGKLGIAVVGGIDVVDNVVMGSKALGYLTVGHALALAFDELLLGADLIVDVLDTEDEVFSVACPDL